MQNNAQVGPSSCAFIFIETAIRIRVRYLRGILWWHHSLNTLRPRQNIRHFADIFKCIFLKENAWISLKSSLKFVPKVRINNIPSLVQIMAWCRPGDKPLSEPMMVSLLTHICVTRPQWVKMADHENCVPVSIGFSETALIPSRIECHSRSRCVFARGNTQRQLMVSLLPEPGFLAKNLPSQAPEWISVPGIAHLNPSEAERMLCPVRQLKLYLRDSERIGGVGGVNGCLFIGLATSGISWEVT